MDRGSGSTGTWEYVDFELEIRKGSRRRYPVCVRSPEGEAQEEMRFPFDKQELNDKLKDLENAVLLSGRRRRRIRSPEAQTVQDFGQSLFQSLLHGAVRTHYDLSLRQAKRQNKGLRLKLRIEPSELAVLPWEFLYDPVRNSYLCLSSKTPLVRYLELREPVEQLPVTPPLKILGMVASPSDLDPLDVEHEKHRVEEAIKDLQARGQVELTWMEGQTARDLQRAMIRGPWHVFHFIGHGGFDPASEEGLLALTNEEDRAHFLHAEDLAQLLKDHWDLRLVLLNSCEGARGSEHDAFSSTAATLVRPGIPAVLANQYEITDEAAIEFSRTFYEAVADGLPVDAAVAYARTSLKIELDNTLEWATPVLYMRSPDGRIFDISTEALPPKPSKESRDPEEEDLLHQYREAVESVWVTEEEETKADSRQGLASDGEIGPATTGSSPKPEEQKQESKQNVGPDGETEAISATIAARRRAEELGVDLREVRGTGAGGQITVADVKKAAVEARKTSSPPPPKGAENRKARRRGMLAAGLIGMVTIAVIGLAIWLLVPDIMGEDEVEVASEEASPPEKASPPAEASKPAPGYKMIDDGFGSLSMEVPSGWTVITGEASEGWDPATLTWSKSAGVSISSSITASSNIDAFNAAGNAAPGIYAVASRKLAQKYTNIDELAISGPNDGSEYRCNRGQSQNLNRSSYSGRMQAWDCSGAGNVGPDTLYTLYAAPRGSECVVAMQIWVGSEPDHKAAQHILDTFEVNCGKIS